MTFREATDQQIEASLDTPPPPKKKRKRANSRKRRWRCEQCGLTSTDPFNLCEPVEAPL